MSLGHPANLLCLDPVLCTTCVCILFANNRAIKYRSVLRKMTYKDKGSYESSPPCIHIVTQYTHMYIYIDVLPCVEGDPRRKLRGSFVGNNRQKPLIMGVFCGKGPVKKRRPTNLRHHV